MRRILGALAMITVAAAPAWAGIPQAVVPEPATMALTAGGLALVGAIAWRRNRKR